MNTYPNEFHTVQHPDINALTHTQWERVSVCVLWLMRVLSHRTSVGWLEQENNQNHFENNSYRRVEFDAGRTIRSEKASKVNGKRARRTGERRKEGNWRNKYIYTTHRKISKRENAWMEWTKETRRSEREKKQAANRNKQPHTHIFEARVTINSGGWRI